MIEVTVTKDFSSEHPEWEKETIAETVANEAFGLYYTCDEKCQGHEPVLHVKIVDRATEGTVEYRFHANEIE